MTRRLLRFDWIFIYGPPFGASLLSTVG